MNKEDIKNIVEQVLNESADIDETTMKLSIETDEETYTIEFNSVKKLESVVKNLSKITMFVDDDATGEEIMLDPDSLLDEIISTTKNKEWSY